MALPRLEDFNRTNGALTLYGFTALRGGLNVASNVCIGNNGSVDNFAMDTDNTYSNDQYSQAVVGTVSSGITDVEIFVRGFVSSGTNCYFMYHSSGDMVIAKYVNDSQSTVASASYPTVAPGDVIRLEVSGTSLVLKVNGSTVITTSDASLASGSPGPGLWTDVLTLDNWEGGNLGASASTEQEGFRARNDDGSETSATWLAAQDANFYQTLDTNTRIRYIINGTGDVASKVYRLEYKLSSNSTWVPLLTSAPGIPTFQAAGTSASSTTTASPAWPTHAIGDIGILAVESCGGEPVSLTTAAGFVIIGTAQATGATTTGTQLTLYWCRATSAAMGAPTVGDPGNHVYARIFTFRSCLQEGNPIHVSGGSVKASASTSVSVTGVTTTVDNCLIAAFCASDVDAATAFMSAQANASWGSLTEQADEGTTQGNGGGIALTTGTKATAGATGTMTATVASSINAFITIALLPQTAPLMMVASSNITGGGEATTAQLTPPTGKTTSAFTTGRMWDDENGTDAIDLAADFYTELEWSFKSLAANGAANAQVYNLRVTDAGTALDTYSVNAQMTIGAPVVGTPLPVNPAGRTNRLMHF